MGEVVSPALSLPTGCAWDGAGYIYMCVSGLLQQYSVGSDDAFDDVEKCKSHVCQKADYAEIC
jgi:hypothetical protein